MRVHRSDLRPREDAAESAGEAPGPSRAWAGPASADVHLPPQLRNVDLRKPAIAGLMPPRTPPSGSRAQAPLPKGTCEHMMTLVLESLTDDLQAHPARSAARASLAQHFAGFLQPYFAPRIERSLFTRIPMVQHAFAHAIVGFSRKPASYYELFNSMFEGSTLSVRSGETLAHALARNEDASDEEKLTCLRMLASEGCDLAAPNSAGTTCAIVAAQQTRDPFYVLAAIDAWDPTAFNMRDAQGWSVADALLANPVAHEAALSLALSAPEMHLNPDKPKAWRPPILPLALARHLPNLVHKPIGAIDANGVLWSAS